MKANSRSSVTFSLHATKVGPLFLMGKADISPGRMNATFGESLYVSGYPLHEFSYLPIDVGFKSTVDISRVVRNGFDPWAQEIAFGGFVVDWDLLRQPMAFEKDYVKAFTACVLTLSYGKHPNQCHRADLNEWYQQIMAQTDADGLYVAQNTTKVWPSVVNSRIIRMADNHINIDNRKLISSMDWIANRFKDISFVEFEKSQISILRMTKYPKITQKAFVLLSFIESGEDLENYAEFIQSMKSYIEKELESCDDMIAFVLANHVLHKLSDDDDEKQDVIRRLKTRAKTDNMMVWWEVNDDGTYSDDELKAVNTEITSYALLTYLKQGSRRQTPSIIRWLGRQLVYKPSLVYMEAMVAAFKVIPYPTNNEQQTWKVFDREFSKRGPIPLSFEHGVDPLIGTVRYLSEPMPTIRNPRINASVVLNDHEINLCLSNENYGRNLVVVEISLPTGFYADMDDLEERFGEGLVEWYEKQHMIKLYVKMEGYYCQSIGLFKRFSVTRQRNNQLVVIYDYYNTVLTNVDYYSMSPGV